MGAGVGVGVDAGAGPDVGTADLDSARSLLSSFVAGFEPARYDGRGAAGLVGVFARIERLAATGKSLAAARATECRQPEAGGHRSAAHWLSEMTGDSLGDSTGVLRLGESMADHPTMEEAARQGKLPPKAAQLVADALRVNPASEDELVEAASHETHQQLRDRCQLAKARGRSAEQAAAHRQRLHDERHCRTWTDQDGAFRLDARLTPDAGASLLASLNARSDRLFHQARKAGLHESSDAYRADALVGLVTGRRDRPPSGTRTGAPDPGDTEAGDTETGDSEPTGTPRPGTPNRGPRSSCGSTSTPCAGGRWDRAGCVRSPAWARCPSRRPES